MPGPAPKDAATRRRTNSPMANTVKLPAAGRIGPTPRWPLPTDDWADAEKDLWQRLWRTPMAAQWEKLGWERVVARYVRLLIAAEQPPYVATLLAECRQMEDRLGMSPMALLRLRWEITDDSAAAPAPAMAPVRRLRVVD